MSRSFARGLRIALLPVVLLGGACTFGSVNSFGISLKEGDKAVREEEHALDLRAGETLFLRGASGSVEVAASADAAPKLRVTFTAYGRDRAEAEKVLARYRVELERTSEGVAVDSTGEPFEVSADGMTMRIAPTIEYRATVPRGAALLARTSSGRVRAAGPLARCDIETGYGSVVVRDIEGDLRARSASGSIEAARVKGDVQIRSGYGSLALESVKGSRVEAESGSGGIRLDRVEAETVELRTGYGSLDLDEVRGAVEATSSNGSIEVEDSTGPLALQSGYGSIDVERVAGAVKASTSSGNVRLDGVQGKIEARSQYGSVGVEGVLRSVEARSSSGKVVVRALPGSRAESPWSLVTSYGSVSLEVPPDFACTLDARTSYGSVESDLAVDSDEAKPAKGTLRGTIHGGGERVRMESANGSISIRSRGGI